MTVVINGTTGITNDGGYTGDGIVFADTTPANTLVTTTGGNVGIGTSSPTVYSGYTTLEVDGTSGGVVQVGQSSTQGGYFAGSSTGVSVVALGTAPILFATGGSSERMRIDSSGNLMVGTSTASGKFRVSQIANDIAFRLDMSNTGFTNQMMYLTCNTAEGTGYTVMVYRNENAARDDFIIFGNGNVQNRNNSYAGISDIKLKENIVDATPKLADLMQVKVRTYNLIGDTQKQIGVVAQELEEVFPSLVEESPDREMRKTVDEDGNETESMFDLGTTTKSVKYSVFVPMLIKAMQEQQTLITQLRADVEALKSA